MERPKNRAARKYLRTVRGLLPCSRKMKNEITEPLQRSMSEFLEEDPAAASEDIRARFGAPEIIAASCLEEVETSELLCRLRIRRKIIAIVVAAVFLILTSWTAFVAVKNQKYEKTLAGYDTVEFGIVSIETEATTDAITITP